MKTIIIQRLAELRGVIPSRFRIYIMGTLLLLSGATIALLSELWWETPVPAEITINDIEIKKHNDGSYILLASITFPPSKSCTGLSDHILYRDRTSGYNSSVRDFVPLASPVSSPDFYGTNYTVTLSIPEGIPSGQWKYLDRIVFICTVFPGFVRVSDAVSIERPIEIR